MCGQAEGVARGWAGLGWQGRRARDPRPRPAEPQLPTHRMQRRLRTERPRPQELEQWLQEPHGVHSPGPYLGRESHS